MGQTSTTSSPSHNTPSPPTTSPYINPDQFSDTTSSSPHIPPTWITLTCNTKSFPIRRSLLTPHTLFANHLSFNPHDTCIELAALQNDEEIALHIVNYLTNPTTFPFFHSAQTGFHYALYQHLRKAAAALELWELYDWIENETYLHALKTVVEVEVEEVEVGQLPTKTVHEGDVDVSVEMLRKTRYWYFCPRGVPAHRVERGSERLCGKKCEVAREHGVARLEEEQYLEVVTVTKRVVFDAEVCKRKTAVDVGAREGTG